MVGFRLGALVAAGLVAGSGVAAAAWTESSGPYGHEVRQLIEATDGTLLVPSYGSLAARPPGATRWGWAGLEATRHGLYAVAQALDGSVLATTERGLYRRIPVSGTWEYLGVDIAFDTLVPLPDGSVVGLSYSVLWRSPDGVHDWRELPASLPIADPHFGFELQGLAVLADGRLLVAGRPLVQYGLGGAGGLWRSTDRGVTWRLGRHVLDTVTRVARDSTGRWCATDGRQELVTSEDGIDWQPFDSGLTSRYPYGWEIDDLAVGDHLIFAGTNRHGLLVRRLPSNPPPRTRGIDRAAPWFSSAAPGVRWPRYTARRQGVEDMAVKITVPTVGESITEGVIAEWLKADGDWVEAGDDLYVLETDKITTNVPADESGRLKITVAGGETVEIGQEIGAIDTSAAKPKGGTEEAPTQDEATAPAEKAPAADLSDLSPAVRRMVVEHDLDPAAIAATGRGGRLTKEDVVRHMERPAETQPKAKAEPEPAAKPKGEVERFPKASVATSRPEPGPATAKPKAEPGERQTREPMSRLRLRIAERLVEVQQTTAILTTFNEADMSRIMALRASYKEDFKQRHDVGLGFMSFFVKASVEALRTVPAVNSYIDGSDLIRNHFYDIGVAVSTERGLVVPVVRDADRLSMAEIERRIMDLATRAHERRLELSDLQGAIFTVSNGGIFGSMMSTPILNPPGSAILGMHAIQKRAVVVADEIVIRPMMYLAVSYDHRVIDGREAVTFLKRIKECLENPERMLLEV